jgi:hypothetical protein
MDRRATIRLSRGLRVVVRVTELSLRQISIRYSAPAETGAVLEIEFGLPVNGVIQAIKLHGEVCRSHLQADEYYTLMKLVNLSDKDRDLIQRFIRYREYQRMNNS